MWSEKGCIVIRAQKNKYLIEVRGGDREAEQNTRK
jgi:hypothetical protein